MERSFFGKSKKKFRVSCHCENFPFLSSNDKLVTYEPFPNFLSSNDKLATMPPRHPDYMFPPGSGITDSPRGDLIPLIRLLNTEEIVVVMYYAPWCSKSQRAKAEYMKAANYFTGKVGNLSTLFLSRRLKTLSSLPTLCSERLGLTLIYIYIYYRG